MSVNIHGKQYRTVAERINLFYERFGKMHTQIITEIVKDDGNIIQVKATINVDDRRDSNNAISLLGTGYAEEDRSKGRINSTSALENCETSAIGRALASIGLGGEEYASANEVENAIHQQKKITVNDGSQFDQTQKKPNQDLVEALENDKPILNGTVDEAMKKMTNGNSPWMAMPFGKHKGITIDQLEPDYVRWCIKNMDLEGDLEEQLRQRFYSLGKS
jgi:uncharacterized protein (DUF3820 family)|tara:strand:+ start:4253 stop:4909 length:657 start_codon:yes stop_codon:yes gene_type:complete